MNSDEETSVIDLEATRPHERLDGGVVVGQFSDEYPFVSLQRRETANSQGERGRCGHAWSQQVVAAALTHVSAVGSIAASALLSSPQSLDELGDRRCSLGSFLSGA